MTGGYGIPRISNSRRVIKVVGIVLTRRTIPILPVTAAVTDLDIVDRVGRDPVQNHFYVACGLEPG